MDSLKNLVNKTVQKVATPFIGVLKDSKFLKEGVLTPEEFVIAGDQLTYKCQTWSWQSGLPGKKNANLPDDKQYLITKGVPCTKRIKQLQAQQESKERDLEDGWVETDNPMAKEKTATVDIDEMEVVDAEMVGADEQEEEAVDIDDMADDNVFATGKYVVKQ